MLKCSVDLFELAIALIGLALAGVYFACYRWLLKLLGEPIIEPLPSARVLRGRRHVGYRREPTWLRPVQALLLATGVTLSLVIVLGVLAVAGAMLLV